MGCSTLISELWGGGVGGQGGGYVDMGKGKGVDHKKKELSVWLMYVGL